MYQAIIFVHVVSGFLFFMAHGVSIGVALWLRRERQPERLRPLLELSGASKMAVRVALVVLLLSGVAGGFMLNWWRMGWIWVSLVLLVVMTAIMMRGVSPYFNALRKAVGSPYEEGGKRQPAREPTPAAELEALLKNADHIMHMALLGIGVLVIIVFLMMAKPF